VKSNRAKTVGLPPNRPLSKALASVPEITLKATLRAQCHAPNSGVPHPA